MDRGPFLRLVVQKRCPSKLGNFSPVSHHIVQTCPVKEIWWSRNGSIWVTKKKKGRDAHSLWHCVCDDCFVSCPTNMRRLLQDSRLRVVECTRSSLMVAAFVTVRVLRTRNQLPNDVLLFWALFGFSMLHAKEFTPAWSLEVHLLTHQFFRLMFVDLLACRRLRAQASCDTVHLGSGVRDTNMSHIQDWPHCKAGIQSLNKLRPLGLCTGYIIHKS